MKKIQVWALRPDAPYKSELVGLWIVPAEQVPATAEQIRADYCGGDDIPIVEGPVSAGVDSCSHEPECAYGDDGLSVCAQTTVMFVADFVPGEVDVAGPSVFDDWDYDDDTDPTG